MSPYTHLMAIMSVAASILGAAMGYWLLIVVALYALIFAWVMYHEDKAPLGH